jgi:hypothetical protein
VMRHGCIFPLTLIYSIIETISCHHLEPASGGRTSLDMSHKVNPWGTELAGLPEVPLLRQEDCGLDSTSSEQSRAWWDQRQCAVHIDHQLWKALLQGITCFVL